MGSTLALAERAVVDAQEEPGLSVPIRAARWSPALAAWLVGLATTVLYGGVSLFRFWRLDAGVDLAIFGEAVKRYSEGSLPWSNIKAVEGFNLLGDHFSPVIAAIAPISWKSNTASPWVPQARA